MSFRHLLRFLPLFIVLLSTFANPGSAQENVCPNKCRNKATRAYKDCRSGTTLFSNCTVRQCSKKSGSTGWQCEPNEQPPSAKCRDRCRKRRVRAEVDCLTVPGLTQIEGCEVQECRDTQNGESAITGYKCAKAVETPTPPPTPPPQPAIGRVYGDPHIASYDGYSYDCQGVGEFILSRSEIAELDLRGRFGPRGSAVSWVQGIAIEYLQIPIIDLFFAEGHGTERPPNSIKGCGIFFSVGGTRRNLNSGSGHPGFTIKVSRGNIYITLTGGLRLIFDVYGRRGNNCLAGLNVFLPKEIVAAGDVRGLLGTPNQDPRDEWTKRDGTKLPLSRSKNGRRGSEGYEFCTKYWCVSDAANSLFTQQGGVSFSQLNECEAGFPGLAALDNPPADVKDLCGLDLVCLIDAIYGDISDGKRALIEQAADQEVATTLRPFRFFPATVFSGNNQLVLATVDMRDRSDAELAGVKKFFIYEFVEETASCSAGRLGAASDDAKSVDAISNDKIFTTTINVALRNDGESLSFCAIPVINGKENPNSALLRLRYDGVTAYSPRSGLAVSCGARCGVAPTPTPTVSVNPRPV